MLIGYARTSTTDQTAGLAAQERDLRTAGADKVFMEQVSSVSTRKALRECLEYVRSGDALVVTKPDRLARNTSELLTIEADLAKRGIGLVVWSASGKASPRPRGKADTAAARQPSGGKLIRSRPPSRLARSRRMSPSGSGWLGAQSTGCWMACRARQRADGGRHQSTSGDRGRHVEGRQGTRRGDGHSAADQGGDGSASEMMERRTCAELPGRTGKHGTAVMAAFRASPES